MSSFFTPEVLAALALVAAGVFAVVRVYVRSTASKTDDAVVDAIGQVVDPLLPGDQSKPKE